MLLANSIFRRALNKKGHMIALFIFVTTPVFYRYANEFKQYIFDLAILELILFLYLKTHGTYSRKNLLTLGLVGAFATWFSLVSIFTLAFIGLIMFSCLASRKEKTSQYKDLFQYCFLLWLISFGIYYVAFLYNHPHRQYQAAYWKYEDGLHGFPLSYQIKEVSKWSIEGQVRILSYFSLMKSKPTGTITILLMALGLFSLISKEKNLGIKFIYLPILIHVISAILNVYPFSFRLCLYLLPIYIFLVTKGLEQLQNKKIILCLIIFAISIFWSYNLIKERISESISIIKSSYEDKLFSYLDSNIYEDENVVLLNRYAMIYQIYYHNKYPLRNRNVLYDYKSVDNIEVDLYNLFKNNSPDLNLRFSSDGLPNPSVFDKLEKKPTWFVYHNPRADLLEVARYLIKFNYIIHKQISFWRCTVLDTEHYNP